MLTPEELKARRKAATKEAKNSIPVVGIVVALIVLGALGMGLKSYLEYQRKQAPSVVLRYIRAQQADDIATMKSLATARSVGHIDRMIAAAKFPENQEKITNFKALSFNVDKVEEKTQTPALNIDGVSVTKYKVVTLTKAIPEKAQRLDDTPFIVIPFGETWKVDEVASEGMQGDRLSRFPLK